MNCDRLASFFHQESAAAHTFQGDEANFSEESTQGSQKAQSKPEYLSIEVVVDGRKPLEYIDKCKQVHDQRNKDHRNTSCSLIMKCLVGIPHTMPSGSLGQETKASCFTGGFLLWRLGLPKTLQGSLGQGMRAS